MFAPRLPPCARMRRATLVPSWPQVAGRHSRRAEAGDACTFRFTASLSLLPRAVQGAEMCVPFEIKPTPCGRPVVPEGQGVRRPRARGTGTFPPTGASRAASRPRPHHSSAPRRLVTPLSLLAVMPHGCRARQRLRHPARRPPVASTADVPGAADICGLAHRGVRCRHDQPLAPAAAHSCLAFDSVPRGEQPPSIGPDHRHLRPAVSTGPSPRPRRGRRTGCRFGRRPAITT